MARMMHRNTRATDLMSHARLLDGVAVIDGPTSGYNLPQRNYHNGNQSIMDGGVLIRGTQHNTNSGFYYPWERHFMANLGYVQNAMNQHHRGRSQRAPESSRRPVNLTQLTLLQFGIQDASYEQLLVLGERIGNVSTGLSEQTIASKLRTRTYSLPLETVNPETEVCIICQEEYKNWEIIGRLSCEHEYHADCLKKWLVQKNECPVCRSRGLTMD